MEITKVTLTGADDSTDPKTLFELSKRFPFVEWGILASRTQCGGNRFPSRGWIKTFGELYERTGNLNMSLHLCGAYVREILMGGKRWWNEHADVWTAIKRVQINTHGAPHQFDKTCFMAMNDFQGIEFIFQYDAVNNNLVEQAKSSGVNLSALFDLSHGAGILPENWPQPLSMIKCGYAGGLSPENVSGQIENLDSILPKDAEIWIDMETHLRSNNDSVFDLEKCVDVLRVCQNSGLIK